MNYFLAAIIKHHDQGQLIEGRGLEGLTLLDGRDMEAGCWVRSGNLTGLEGANWKCGYAVNSQPAPPTLSKATSHLQTVSPTGNQLFKSLSLWGTLSSKPPPGEDKIILTNIIHFFLIDLAHVFFLHSCSLTKVLLYSRHNGKL